MIDLDALELPKGEPNDGYVHVETKAYRALIAELRASRKVVEAAAAIPRLKVSLGSSWEREKYAAVGEQFKALYAALAELEALK